MKQSLKSQSKYWYRRYSPNLKSKFNKQEQQNYLDLIQKVNLLQKEQTQRRIIDQNQNLKSHMRNMAEKMLKIVKKLQQIKNVNIRFNQKFIDQHNNIIQLRCPQHNSPIILYCQTDHKLLCAICAFGNQYHKKHIMNEAAKEAISIEIQLKQIDKKMRSSISYLQKQKNKWQQMVIKSQNNWKNVLKQLQKFHQDALEKISQIFLKYKTKMQTFYKNNQNSLSMTINSFNSFIKCLKYDHSLNNVKHLYMQNAYQQIQTLQKLLPNPVIGNNIVNALDKICKINARAFKTIINKLNYN